MKLMSTPTCRLIFAVASFIIFTNSSGQNLVPNTSFEKFKKTPDQNNNLQSVLNWYNPSIGSPEIINKDDVTDPILPPIDIRSGANSCRLAVFSNHNVEYIGSALNYNLKVGSKYYVEFWVNFSNSIIKEFPENFGLKFFNGKVSNNSKWIDVLPDIQGNSNILDSKNDWIKVSGFHITKASMSHIVIGQFKNNKELNYNVFIDDVKIIKVPILNLDSITILFSNNSNRLNSSAIRTLHSISDFMQIYPSSKVTIQGHTDSKGSINYNQSLSRERANAVALHLTQNGVQSSRIVLESFGENQLLNNENTFNDRARNRRVEISIVNQ